MRKTFRAGILVIRLLFAGVFALVGLSVGQWALNDHRTGWCEKVAGFSAVGGACRTPWALSQDGAAGLMAVFAIVVVAVTIGVSRLWLRVQRARLLAGREPLGAVEPALWLVASYVILWCVLLFTLFSEPAPRVLGVVPILGKADDLGLWQFPAAFFVLTALIVYRVRRTTARSPRLRPDQLSSLPDLLAAGGGWGTVQGTAMAATGTLPMTGAPSVAWRESAQRKTTRWVTAETGEPDGIDPATGDYAMTERTRMGPTRVSTSKTPFQVQVGSDLVTVDPASVDLQLREVWRGETAVERKGLDWLFKSVVGDEESDIRRVTGLVPGDTVTLTGVLHRAADGTVHLLPPTEAPELGLGSVSGRHQAAVRSIA